VLLVLLLRRRRRRRRRPWRRRRRRRRIAMGLPCSESPRTTIEAGPILTKIRCNLTCFRLVPSCDLLGWGSGPYSALKNYIGGTTRRVGNRPDADQLLA
jgi:hypothetical protein